MFLGRLAGITQIVFAVLIAAVASLRFEPGFVPRGVVLLVAFGLPGVIGLLGVASRRSSLLLAAGVASAIGSFVAFSGVTLIFLVPAILFIGVAMQLAAAGPTDRAANGLIGEVGRFAAAIAIVALLVGAGGSGILLTDSACWSEYPTASGIRVEVSPYAESGPIAPGASSSTCSTGVISARGAGLGGALALAALGLAILVSRRASRA